MVYNYFTGDYHADSFIMFDYLSDLELVTGNDRSGRKFFNKKQQSQSTKFGYTWRKRRGDFDREYCPLRKLYKTKLNEDNPALLKIFEEYRDIYFNSFEFSEVTINKMVIGTNIKMHLDKVNVGDSVLVAFGNYTGGKTLIQNKDDSNFIVKDARDEPIIFNGSQRKHSVTTINSGLRYSLVFYKNRYKEIDEY